MNATAAESQLHEYSGGRNAEGQGHTVATEAIYTKAAQAEWESAVDIGIASPQASFNIVLVRRRRTVPDHMNARRHDLRQESECLNLNQNDCGSAD